MVVAACIWMAVVGLSGRGRVYQAGDRSAASREHGFQLASADICFRSVVIRARCG